MGTLANLVRFTGAVISPFLNYNTDIRNNHCKVKTCIKSSDMDIELETSLAEWKYRIKIVLNFGRHFVNGNNVDMSYLRKSKEFDCIFIIVEIKGIFCSEYSKVNFSFQIRHCQIRKVI